MIHATEAPVTPPLQAQAGDELVRIGNVLKLVRGGEVVATATIGQPEPIDSGEITTARTIASIFEVEEIRMPSVSATITGVNVNVTSGIISVNFSNGDQREFADFSEMQVLAQGYDSSAVTAQNLAILALVRRSPDGSNLDVCNGMSVLIDGAANVPVSYSGLPQI